MQLFTWLKVLCTRIKTLLLCRPPPSVVNFFKNNCNCHSNGVRWRKCTIFVSLMQMAFVVSCDHDGKIHLKCKQITKNRFEINLKQNNNVLRANWKKKKRNENCCGDNLQIELHSEDISLHAWLHFSFCQKNFATRCTGSLLDKWVRARLSNWSVHHFNATCSLNPVVNVQFPALPVVVCCALCCFER